MFQVLFLEIAPWTGRFYSLLDPSYAKNNIPIIASVSEHQPTAWSSFYFDLQILVFTFPGISIFCQLLVEERSHRVVSVMQFVQCPKHKFCDLSSTSRKTKFSIFLRCFRRKQVLASMLQTRLELAPVPPLRRESSRK